MSEVIPFNKPYLTGLEPQYLTDVQNRGKLSGDGYYTKLCSDWLVENTGCQKALLTHSCTAALEMAAILLGVGPGDEIIMPSYTFVSTANAFVLRGAIPVFVDVDPDTMNIAPESIINAISDKTKVIVVVHYAGVGCDMDSIMELAKDHSLYVVEDAAQAVGAFYKKRALGSIGHLGTFSFHDTKNIISGEGGALLINDECFSLPAEIIREKGTDRSQFIRGEVDKYTWQTEGSSYLPSELMAAFLWAQLQKTSEITRARVAICLRYENLLNKFLEKSKVKVGQVPEVCRTNGHIFYIIIDGSINRDKLIEIMKERGVHATFHYVPLHSSPAGVKYSKSFPCPNTDYNAANIIRLPVWNGISEAEQAYVVDVFMDAYGSALKESLE